jgi:hypothetical protein
LIHPSFIASFIQSITMNSTSYAPTWKTALEEDEAREESASSFPAVAPIGGAHLSSLQQHAAMGWKQQQQYLQQQQHQQQQQQYQQQQTHSAPADDRWGAGVESPSMKHHFQNNSNKHITNDTTSGWSDQRDTSQHSRASIWTDDHSRSSHTSTGTTSYTGTYSSHGTHPFAANANAAANPTATSGMSHHHDDPLLGDLARLSLGRGHDSSQHHPYYNAMSVGQLPRQQQPHAPAPHNPYYTAAAGVVPTQHNHISSSSSAMSVESSIPGLMGAGSGSTGGTAISQYSWNPQQQQQSRKAPHVQSSLAAAAAATATNIMPPPGFRQPSAEAVGGCSDSHSLGNSSYHSASANTDNESVTSNSDRSRGKRGGRGGGGRGSRYREKQPQQRQQHNHQGRGKTGSGRGNSNNSSMPPPPLREYNSSAAAAAGNIKSNGNVTKEYDTLMHNSERSFVSSSSSLNRAAGAWSGAASATADIDALGSSEAIRQLMKPTAASSYSNHAGGGGGGGSSSNSSLKPSMLEMDGSSLYTAGTGTSRTADLHPILPQALQMNDDSFGHMLPSDDEEDDDEIEGDEDDESLEEAGHNPGGYPKHKEKKWLLRMNRKLAEIPVGELDPSTMPLSAVMNAWAKTKSSQGASMVEMWLKRAQEEYDVGNKRVVPTAKMYTMAGTWLL